MRTKSMHPTLRVVLMMALVLTLLALPVLVLADNVKNDVIAGGSDTFTTGSSTTINYYIQQTGSGGTGFSGCDPADGSNATVTINVPIGVSKVPSSLTFSSCDTLQSVNFSSATSGDYDITVSVSDSHGNYNTASAAFTLHVITPPPPPNTPPVITVPPGGVTAEATSSAGAVVNFTVSATDAEDNPDPTPVCTPASGSLFPLGDTKVNCSVTDSGGLSDTGFFFVTVADTTAPTIDTHGDETAEATSSAGALVDYTAPATHDAVDGDGIASCLPASGSQFDFGQTEVSCDATDNAGNAATSTTFVVHVVDTTDPSINCTVPDQSAWYASDVTVNCTASDSVSGLANSGDSSFSLNTNVAANTETATASTATLEVCDNASNCGTAGPYTFKVDKKAPQVSCANADGIWHASDASIGCNASDGGSGLANAADANFALSTTVPNGTEDANASTNSQTVNDAVGNSSTAGPIAGNMVDKKAPQQTSCDSADGAWHANNVTLQCAYADGGSGPGSQTVNLATSVSAGQENANASASANGAQACDAVGNCATSPSGIGGNRIDRKGPSVTVTGVTDGATYTLGSVPVAGCSTADSGSGVATNATLSSSGGPVGSINVKCDGAVDNVGNSGNAPSVTYHVIYNFTGFFQPVDNDKLNLVKAGSAIPIKFSLGGNQGLNIFESGFPTSGVISCDPNADTDLIEVTVTAGQSTLSYDPAANQYVYVWKTDKAWANSCRILKIKLSDGSATHKATFKFTK